MTQQVQKLLDDIVVDGSSTYGASRTKLPRLRIDYETSPFTNSAEAIRWSCKLDSTLGATRTPATERAFEVCIVALEGTLPVLQKTFRPQPSSVQFERFDAFLVTGNEYWTGDPKCIFEVRARDTSGATVVLEGPDGAILAPAAALSELSVAYAEYEEAIRAGMAEEADDWLYTD